VRGLEGKVAIVTGSGQGIGAACAERLAAEGVNVVVAEIVPERADATVSRIKDSGGEAVAHQVDVSDEDGVRALMKSVIDRWGRLDILHNNAVAGEVRQEQAIGVADLDFAIWERTLQVNLGGYMLGCKHAIPIMRKAGGGSIINTSSVVSFAPLPVQTAYASSKGGINSLTRSVTACYGRFGIRCNAVCPGFIVNESTSAEFTDAFREAALSAMPATRLGRPEDIAAMVAFLASDDGEYLNGQIISVDGGLTTPVGLYGYLSAQLDAASAAG
jgi:NAD(P)-dependent dehydrogenase (short-subunit alcohol dehydrogenase family)